MAYVVTRRALIGEWREPGYVCTSEDLRGRNVRVMEDRERCIRFDPSVPEPETKVADEGRRPTRGRGRAAAEDESSSED